MKHQAIIPFTVVIGFIFAFSLLSAARSAANSLKLDANWRVQAQGNSQQDDTTERFNQRYSLQLNSLVSRAINYSAQMDYNRDWATGQGVRKTVTPNLNFDLHNEFFQANLGAYMNNTYREGSRDLLNRSWQGGISNTWTRPWMPHFGVRFGQSWEDDGEDVPTLDNSNNWGELVADWQYLNTINVSYSYYQSQNNDNVQHSESEEKRHLARFDYRDQFLNNRIMVNFSQQIDQTNSDFNALVDEGGSALIPLLVSQGLSGLDATPEAGALPSNGALVDGNLTNVAVTINFLEPFNIGIRTDLQTVDQIYVSTTRDDGLLIGDVNALKWDLYSSNDGVAWQRKIVNASTVFNREKFRFEVDTGSVKALYIKLVVTGWPTSIVVKVSEMSAYRSLTGDHQVSNEQRTTNYKTNIGLGYNPRTDLRLGYSLTWDKSDINQANNRDRLYQSAQCSWLYSRYFQPTFTVGSTVVDNSEITDTEDRNYSLSVQSSLLDTLQSSIGVSRYESYNDHQKISTSHSINWNNSAILYPGLTSNLDLNLNINRNEVTSDQSSYAGVNFSMTSRMRDNLVVELASSYNGNNIGFVSSDAEGRSEGSTSLQVNYRPSDMLSLLFNGNIGYGDAGDQLASALFDARMTVLRTYKTQVTAGYRINAIQDSTTHTLNGNWSWDLSQYLTFNSNVNYLIQDSGDSWNINGNLNASF